MATENQTTTEQALTSTAKRNVWSKLLAARGEFYAAGAKKTGKNLHAEFTYFELADIVPLAAPIFERYGLLLIPTFVEGNAVAEIVNTENPDEHIYLSIPLQFISEPGKFRMNEVQGVGAAVTYYRRYLYMIVLDLVEADGFDGISGEDAPLPAPKKKPATAEERGKIKKSLTGADGEADDLQKAALKAALKKLKELDPEKEEFIQQIALKTDRFRSVKKAACEKLILTVNEMIGNYAEDADEGLPF